MDRLDPPLPARAPAYWLCQLGGWGLIVGVNVYTSWLRSVPPARIAWQQLCVLVLGIGLTHGFRRVVRGRRWLARPALELAPRILGAALLLALLFVAVALLIEARADHEALSSLASTGLAAVLRWTMVFVVWIIFYFNFNLLEERRLLELHRLRLGQALQTAELRSLKSQLNPHFLFNSLNSVRALIADDPEAAQTAVTRLAKTLRYSLGAQEELVSLDRELEIVEDYLGLEALRLGARLTVERDIAPEARHAQIPVMLLETLVENAIKHGIAQLPAGGTLALAAQLDGGALTLVVTNPRPAQRPAHSDEEPGIGLANARERLRLLYGGAAALELDLSRPEQAIARVRIGRREPGPRA